MKLDKGGNADAATCALNSAAVVLLFGLGRVWHTVGGVTFYVHQIGNQIWCLGEQSPANPLWTNVASGTTDGGVVRVKWVDVPKGRTMHEGTLTLRVVTPNHLMVIQNPNDFWSADRTPSPGWLGSAPPCGGYVAYGIFAPSERCGATLAGES